MRKTPSGTTPHPRGLQSLGSRKFLKFCSRGTEYRTRSELSPYSTSKKVHKNVAPTYMEKYTQYFFLFFKSFCASLCSLSSIVAPTERIKTFHSKGEEENHVFQIKGHPRRLSPESDDGDVSLPSSPPRPGPGPTHSGSLTQINESPGSGV